MNAPIATLEIKATAQPAEISTAYAADDFSHMTLPGWTYHNAEFFELEKEYLFLSNWMLVCHVSEVKKPGDFATLRLMGERALVVRGEDGELRAFYNVCRHRAAAVVQGRTGSCSSTGIRCPYHGWVYGFDGSLKAVPAEATFPGLNKAEYGLKPLDLEVCLGFVFIRFRSVGPSVAERLAPYMAELAPYRLEEMEPFGELWAQDYDVDWKNAIDNYLEGYHVPVGHPGLYRLFGTRYDAEAREGYVSRAMHWLRDKPSSNWSERHYQKLLPEVSHLPEDRRRAWTYYTLLPNLGFDLYPDMIDFFQLIPAGPGKCRLRGRCYRLASDNRPEMKAAQFLNYRINTQVQREDDDLVRSVQAGLASESYSSGILSEKEVCLRQFHDMVREILPVARLPEPPEPGTMWTLNETLSKV
jgi:phenylpropionate dioxygenase-like ring-hydroxylating dioxygenase large terminal subunit